MLSIESKRAKEKIINMMMRFTRTVEVICKSGSEMNPYSTSVL